MKPANNGPLYASLYPELAEIFRQHGYALAVHGSVASDLDLIAVPWIENPSKPQAVIADVVNQFCFKVTGDLTPKLHGRVVQTLAYSGGGTMYLDVSFVAVAGWDDEPEPSSELLTAEQLFKACAAKVESFDVKTQEWITPEPQPFKAGDLVVWINRSDDPEKAGSPEYVDLVRDKVYLIDKVRDDGLIVVDGDSHYAHRFRHATAAEVAAHKESETPKALLASDAGKEELPNKAGDVNDGCDDLAVDRSQPPLPASKMPTSEASDE